MITKRQTVGVTQQQIADELGISRQLVTHALNGTRHSRISEETTREIKRVARAMNYRPRNLTTHNIGYLLPTEGAFLEAEHTFALQVERAARKAGYRLIVVGVQEISELGSLRETFNAKTVDGVISPRWYDGKFARSLPSEVPSVLVADADGITPQMDAISIDARATVEAMTQYLMDFGHRQIGIVMSDSDEVKQHRDIIQGALDALRRGGLPVESLTLARGDAEKITSDLKKLLSRKTAPTGWIAASSTYATALLFTVYHQELRVPEDVSVMSFIDSPHFLALPTPLTTTTAYGAELAELVVNRLIAKIEEPHQAAAHRRLTARIIPRASVAAPGKRNALKR